MSLLSIRSNCENQISSFCWGIILIAGNRAKRLVDFIIDLFNKGFNITALAGNHEAMLIDSYRS